MTQDLNAQQYVVLRLVSPQSVADDQLRFGTAAVEDPSEVEFVVESLTAADAADLDRTPEVFAAAPLLPLRLVEPVERRAAELPAEPGSAWGVEAVGALSSPNTGSGIKVAVLDTGIEAGHTAFAQLKVTQRDFTGEGNGDRAGHGTHCAATIAGGEVDGFRCGVAPGVDELLAGKVLGSDGGSTSALLDGLLWALGCGAHVISMSLGLDFPGFVDEWVRQGFAVQAATSRALAAYRDNLKLFGQIAGLFRNTGPYGRGALVIAATGNESQRGTAKPYTIDVSPPAAADGFIAVGALRRTPEGQWDVASFSNTGATVAAPGVDILSAKAGGGYVTMSGTSMAAPHVAGVAALWAERERMMTPDRPLDVARLYSRITGHAEELAGLDPVDVGAGLVRAPSSSPPTS
jgi:subtilisin family serine protease